MCASVYIRNVFVQYFLVVFMLSYDVQRNVRPVLRPMIVHTLSTLFFRGVAAGLKSGVDMLCVWGAGVSCPHGAEYRHRKTEVVLAS